MWTWDFPKRLLRVPSFRLAYAINVVILVVFVLWSCVDTWFWYLSRLIGAQLSVHDFPGAEGELGWARFGPRAALFAGLAVVGILSLIVFVCRLFVGQSSGRSVASWLASIALFAVWTSVLLSTGPYTGAEYRVRRDLHHFQAVITALRANHFTRGIKMDSGDVIDCIRSVGDFDSFSIKYVNPLSIHESVSLGYWLNDGVYLFLLHSSHYALEFHSRGTTPSDLPIGLRQRYSLSHLKEWTDLGDGWFITRY
jgi:hypothetical protein